MEPSDQNSDGDDDDDDDDVLPWAQWKLENFKKIIDEEILIFCLF